MEKTTNWQIRLDKRTADLVRKKAKNENRSLNGTITLIIQIYFGLKKEQTKLINVTDLEHDTDIYT